MTEPIDFAIVTALKVERDAVMRRLVGLDSVQDENEPLTYYTGQVAIPGNDKPYSVIVIQLLDIGNNDAGIATTRLIRRWQPRNVVMVGIAGGVRGKVGLGDVVVAHYSYYYEPAKLIAGAEERRARHFNADMLLYGRAMSYEADEWKSEIHVRRPDAEEDVPRLPQVHFGPIACGEKVIADLDELAKLLGECPKLTAVAMEGAGVARAVASDGTQPRFLEVRGVCDYAGPDKSDTWHEYAANAAAAFTLGYLRSRPVPPGPSPDQPGSTKATRVLILRAQSLRQIGAEELIPALDSELKSRELEVVPLDFTDLVVNKAIADPETAVRRLAAPQGALVGALGRQAGAQLVFHGLANIPLVVLAGHLVSDRQPVRLFDFHPDTGSWAWPGNGDSFPVLEAAGVPKRLVQAAGDAIIRMSISYRSVAAQTDRLGLDAPVQIELTLPGPSRGVVRSEAQTRAYGLVFRETLDLLSLKMPRCHRVHLFYAGPMALAFHLGQQVSENIHPPVVAWHFKGKYEWGINLTAAVIGESSIVRPAV